MIYFSSLDLKQINACIRRSPFVVVAIGLQQLPQFFADIGTFAERPPMQIL
jgi:hypothetical protein